MSNLPHRLVFVQVDDVNAELHKKAVNAFARHYPEPFAFRQRSMFKQPDTACFAGVGHGGAGRQHLSLRLVSHNDFQSLVYNTEGTI